MGQSLDLWLKTLVVLCFHAVTLLVASVLRYVCDALPYLPGEGKELGDGSYKMLST